MIVAVIVGLCVYITMRDKLPHEASYVYSYVLMTFVGTFIVTFFIMYYSNLRIRDNEKLAFDNMKRGEPEF